MATKYAKIYSDTYEGSLGQDWRLRALFYDLLALCDWHGRIKDDYGGIAAKTCRNIDDVVNGVAELMKPDPRSRSKKLEGRRVTWIDDKLPQLGFLVVNYAKYRDRGRRDRRDYQAQWKRDKKSTKVDQRSTNGRPRLPGTVDHRSTNGRHESTTNINTKHVNMKRGRNALDVVTPSSPSGSDSDSDLIQDVAIAKSEINQQIFNGRLSEKHWSHEALRALAEQMPMKKSEIWTVGFHMSEVQQTNPPSLTNLLRWWPDRYTKAAAWEEANFPS